MEETKLICANLQELAEILKQHLLGRSFIFTRKRFYKDHSPLETTWEQCRLNQNVSEPIRWGVIKPGHHRLAKSFVTVLLEGLGQWPNRELCIHPSVRCGGNAYPDNGHRTWFVVQPEKIEIRDGLSNRHYTFQSS